MGNEMSIKNEQELASIARYNKVVDSNIAYLERLNSIKKEFDKNKYKDPDLKIETMEINGLYIDLSTDGLCGINKIIEFSKEEDIVKNYKLIRENNYLLWPAYAMSINQQRGFKSICDDRIDLLMIDLQKFYNIINEDDKDYFEIIKRIQNDCCLFRAYLNMFTFIWLKSFGTFDKFIEDNHYDKFVKKDIKADGRSYECKALNWTQTKEFDQKYFDALIKRLEGKVD